MWWTVWQQMMIVAMSVAWLAGQSTAKVFDTSITVNSLKQSPTRYLTKFKYYSGGQVILEVKPELAANSFLKGLNLTLGLLSHDAYLRMEELKTCQEKQAVASRLIDLQIQENGTLRLEENVNDRLEGGEFVYFVVFACKLTPRYPSSKAKFHFLLELRNRGTHFSAGDELMMHLYGGFAVGFAAVFTLMAKSFCAEMMKKSAGETNYPYIVVNCCLLLKLASLLMDLADIYLFAQDGLGFEFLNFLSQTCNHLSSYLLVVLLVLLAKGWTLIFDDLAEFELFMPISMVVGIFKVVVIGLGRLDDNSPFFFHRFDSFVGWLLAALNVGMWLYFLYEGLETLQLVGSGSKAGRFVKSLLALGSLYFAVFPLLLIGSLWMSAEHRWQLIELGRLLSQLAALACAAWATGRSKGTFKSIATFETGIQLPAARNENKSEKDMK